MAAKGKIRKGWVVPKRWPGETVVCLATGPSVTVSQLATIYRAYLHDRCRVIAVANSYIIAPWADMLYACDIEWWKIHFDDVRLAFDSDLWVSCDDRVKGMFPEVKWIPYNGRDYGLSEDPTIINSGMNSGHQAVNIASLMGASKILLVGYDHKIGDGNGKHWFGEHPQDINKISNYGSWIKLAWSKVPESAKKLGVQIINCTPDSALIMFRTSTVEAELEC